MPYVPVPKDLTKVKTKLAFNLTKRQLICFSLAALVGLPVYFLTRGTIGNSAAVLLMIGLMMPFFFFAMYERDGQPAEKLLKARMRHKLWPRQRPYRTENLYRTLDKKEVSHIVKNQTAGGTGKTSAEKCKAGKKNQKRRKKRQVVNLLLPMQSRLRKAAFLPGFGRTHRRRSSRVFPIKKCTVTVSAA